MDFLQFSALIVAALCTIYYCGQGSLVMRKFYELLHGKAGCNPVDGLSNVNLHYFKGRGRAEAIRLILEDTETSYNETQFTRETWPEAKQKGINSGIYTFGQVPAIVADGGFSLVQSQAIVHYIGRATGLDCYCQDLEQCDVLAAGTEDLQKHLSKLLYGDITVENRRQYLEETLPGWFRHYEKLAPDIGPGEASFFTSGRLTWVDYIIFNMLDVNVEFGKYNFGEPLIDVLDKFPKLQSFYNLFKQRPKISGYLESSRRLPYNELKLTKPESVDAKQR